MNRIEFFDINFNYFSHSMLSELKEIKQEPVQQVSQSPISAIVTKKIKEDNQEIERQKQLKFERRAQLQDRQSYLESISKDLMERIIAPQLEPQDLVALSKASPMLAEKTTNTRENVNGLLNPLILGPNLWKKVGFEVKDIPDLPKNIVNILEADCPFFVGKKVHQTHKLVLIPAGLDIHRQGELMKHLSTGNPATVFRGVLDELDKNIGDQKILKSYWILVTWDVIPGSRSESFENQQALIAKCPRYRLPTALEAIVLPTMNLESSGKDPVYLLGQNPTTYTRCSDNFEGDILTVGSFAPWGLDVDIDPLGDWESNGVLAVWEFIGS